MPRLINSGPTVRFYLSDHCRLYSVEFTKAQRHNEPSFDNKPIYLVLRFPHLSKSVITTMTIQLVWSLFHTKRFTHRVTTKRARTLILIENLKNVKIDDVI